MGLWQQRAWDPRPVATAERSMLLELLRSLSPAEWLVPTSAPGWRVKDVALHLLDADLSWLSHQRDADQTVVIDMTERSSFADRLAEKNQRWVDAAQGLSLQVTAGLLEWSGRELDELHATRDLMGEGRVSWASDEPVPCWFNLAQELTERWVHQRQMREAVGRIEGHDAHLPDVLRTFVWAFPHQVRAAAPDRSQVLLTIDGVGVWTLTRDRTGWTLASGPARNRPIARLDLSAQAAWRQLTGAEVRGVGLQAHGDHRLIDAMLQVRSIII